MFGYFKSGRASSKFRRKKIGLALSSGAARGFAHIGVIKVLEESQIPVSMIAGTSMGALIGALYAAGLSGDELEEIACNVDIKTAAKLFAPTPSLGGLVSGNRIQDALQSLVGDVNIEDLKIPFAAVAVDIKNAEEVVIREGSLTEAIRASISVPGIFTAVNYQNRFLVDGGLINPVPVDVVQEMGADFVIAVNIPYPTKSKPVDITLKSANKGGEPAQIANSKSFNSNLATFVNKVVDLNQLKSKFNGFAKGAFGNKGYARPNIFKVIMTTTKIMENQIKDLQLQRYKPDILIEPKVDIASNFDFHKARRIIKLGEQEAKKVLGKII